MATLGAHTSTCTRYNNPVLVQAGAYQKAAQASAALHGRKMVLLR